VTGRWSQPSGYVIAMLAASGAVLVRWALEPWVGTSVPLAPLFAAVAITIWFGGTGPAILTTTFGYLTCYVVFVLPQGDPVLGPRNLTRLAMYLTSCAVLVGFGEAMRRTQRRLIEEQANAEESTRLARDAEERARARTAELTALTESVPAAVWIAHDRECRLITGNSTAHEIMRISTGINHSLTAPPFEQPANVTILKNGIAVPETELPLQLAAATGVEIREAELTLVFADGTATHILGNAVPLRGADGAIRGAVGAFVDISQRGEAEEALRDADRRKDQFLAILAHELRNPLAPIRNAAEMLRVKTSSSPELAWAWEIIDRQIVQMTHLIDDLMDVSRISRNTLPLRPGRVDLSMLIRDAVDAIRPALERSNHSLDVAVPQDAIYLDADSTRMTQVFANLLDNAARFTEPGGRIRLLAERRGNEAVVSVKDNGIGISAEMQRRIFEPFTQVDSSLERLHGGLGVGLSLVKQLVEMHGGRVEVHSEGLGRGSEFTVHVPLSPARTGGAPALGTQAPHAANGARILVVDDNNDAAKTLGGVLNILGYQTRTAFDGQGALEAAAEFQPDAVLLDLGMPAMNGYDVARSLRQQPGGDAMVIIAVTGWGQEEDRRRTIAAGFNSHLVKPVDLPSLARQLAELIKGRRDL
jgi:signal transduction histidine kinase/ActR/RegA family two-component response regulator